MTEDHIVLNLLDFYKSKGINLDQILDDPFFKSLSLETKLAAIKKYADTISKGTARGVTKSDIKGILASMIYDGIGAGMAAYGTATAAAKLFNNGKAYHAPIAGVGIAGAIAGATIPLLGTIMKSRQREQLHRQLETTAARPTDKNAFNALVLKGLHNRYPATVNPRLVKIIEKATTYKGSGQEEHVRTMTEDYNEYLGNEKIHPPVK